MNEPAAGDLRDCTLPAPHRSPASRSLVLTQTISGRQYLEMEQAFRASGGIANADQLTTSLLGRTDQPISRLARWIVARDVLSFRWRSLTMLPMFQFDASTLSPRAGVSDTVRELVPALSDWDASLWFAQPNEWLAGAVPADVIAADPQAVFDAARAHRCVVRG